MPSVLVAATLSRQQPAIPGNISMRRETADLGNATLHRHRSSWIEVVDLHQQTTRFRLERTVKRTWRPAGIGVRPECFAALAMLVVSDRQVAGKQKHFFPIFVNERRCRVDAWREA